MKLKARFDNIKYISVQIQRNANNLDLKTIKINIFQI
jgi:hypothetical protein